MVLRSELDAHPSQSVHFADGVISDLVLKSSESSAGTWLPVRGDLVSVLADLARCPNFSFVSVGETSDGLQRSYYLARAAHDGQYFAGYCAFHLTGGRIRVHGRELVASKYEVLAAAPETLRWYPATQNTALSDILPLDGGWIIKRSTYQVEPTSIVRYMSERGVHYGSLTSGSAFESFSAEQYPETNFEDIDPSFDILTIDKARNTSAADASPAPDSRLKVMLGRYYPKNYCRQVKKGDRFESAVTFPEPMASVPRVVMGFDYLDMSNHGSWLRLHLTSRNVMKESFICKQESWSDTILFNCGETWAVINEPGWQAGAFSTQPPNDGSSFDNRVTFATPFASPPMVFVCFDGFDLSGLWDIRVMATNIDQTGFSITIVKPDGKVSVSYASWIAIPADEVIRHKRVWMGRFSTATGKRIAGKDGEWNGKTKFGFEFKRTPKIFLGVDQLSFDNDKYLRLSASVSNVTKSGMDWYIGKWNNTILRNVGVGFLALDCD